MMFASSVFACRTCDSSGQLDAVIHRLWKSSTLSRVVVLRRFVIRWLILSPQSSKLFWKAVKHSWLLQTRPLKWRRLGFSLLYPSLCVSPPLFHSCLLSATAGEESRPGGANQPSRTGTANTSSGGGEGGGDQPTMSFTDLATRRALCKKLSNCYVSVHMFRAVTV